VTNKCVAATAYNKSSNRNAIRAWIEIPSGIKQQFLSAMNYYYHHYQLVITLQYFDRPQSRVANSRLVLIDFNALELLQRREAIFLIK
jgi:hypothetical protein